MCLETIPRKGRFEGLEPAVRNDAAYIAKLLWPFFLLLPSPPLSERMYCVAGRHAVTLSVCPPSCLYHVSSARRIGLGGEGNALYSVLSRYYYPAPGRGTGYCFRAISFFLSFFLYLFLCQQHYEKTAGPICMKFSGKVWSNHGTT